MITLFQIAGIPILAGPFSLLPVLFALILEKPGTLLLNLFALFLHELCHTFTAGMMGYRIKQIELQPLGFVARLQRRIPGRKDELAVAAAGPLFSLIAGFLSCFAAEHFPMQQAKALLSQFGKINIFLGMFNLLPALPLDGGRMAECLFSLFCSKKPTKKLFLYTGLLTSLACFLLGICLFLRKNREAGLSLTAVGCFLGASVFREKTWQRTNAADSMVRRYQQLKEGRSVPVRTLALHADTPCAEALLSADLRFYTVIVVISDTLDVLGTVTEGELFLKTAEKGQDLPLSAVLKLR